MVFPQCSQALWVTVNVLRAHNRMCEVKKNPLARCCRFYKKKMTHYKIFINLKRSVFTRISKFWDRLDRLDGPHRLKVVSI